MMIAQPFILNPPLAISSGCLRHRSVINSDMGVQGKMEAHVPFPQGKVKTENTSKMVKHYQVANKTTKVLKCRKKS